MSEFGPSMPNPEHPRPSVDHAEPLPVTADHVIDLSEAAEHRREDTAIDLGRTAVAAEATHSREGADIIGTNVTSTTQTDYGDEHAVERQRQEGALRIETTLTDFDHDAEVGGDPVARLDDWHPQGRNDHGYKSTCAIECVQEISRQMGVPTSENELVNTAVDRGLCVTSHENPADNGGITTKGQLELLSSIGLHGESLHGGTVEGLAKLVDEGHGVIARVDARYLISGGDHEFLDAMLGIEADHPTENHHTVHVTGTVRHNGDLSGFVINDPTDKPGQMVDITVMEHGWQDLGGRIVLVRRPEE